MSCDLIVVGAGPAGLFATYYAGFRGLTVALVDSLPELGGQVTAMYPEKAILDVAGFPTVKGRDLVTGLVEQARTAVPVELLGRTANDLVADGSGVRLTLDDGTVVQGVRW
ncbi:FAD-dependent oxidoreductase [Nocardioides sambongensis]|uniref:FAD-dependent oxidoreductase n=1 Tax=Nocardioides sambongensis TaxID=2589074 RepID=UPI001E4F3105|nr:FAD-dependent oxidoreductase [Nocardioides sambongensis]